MLKSGRLKIYLSLIFHSSILPFFFLSFSSAQEDREFTSISEALKNPDEVYKLNLRKQKFKEIPPEIFRLKNLKTLNMSKNKIYNVPKEIGQLENLVELDMSDNKIELLPMEIGELKNLKKLMLGKNEIYSLPSSFGNFSQLEYLDLWSNNITEIPNEMSNLSNLKILDMRLIQMNKQKQQAIQQMLPKTLIYFSQSCNCD